MLCESEASVYLFEATELFVYTCRMSGCVAVNHVYIDFLIRQGFEEHATSHDSRDEYKHEEKKNVYV